MANEYANIPPDTSTETIVYNGAEWTPDPSEESGWRKVRELNPLQDEHQALVRPSRRGEITIKDDALDIFSDMINVFTARQQWAPQEQPYYDDGSELVFEARVSDAEIEERVNREWEAYQEREHEKVVQAEQERLGRLAKLREEAQWEVAEAQGVTSAMSPTVIRDIQADLVTDDEEEETTAQNESGPKRRRLRFYVGITALTAVLASGAGVAYETMSGSPKAAQEICSPDGSSFLLDVIAHSQCYTEQFFKQNIFTGGK